MKTVVSVSLGSSSRDKTAVLRLLGEDIELRREGCDGDMARFGARFAELDGKVDALGVGGADVWLVQGHRRYAFAEIEKLVSRAKVTPVVDGSGLKHTLEREAIERLAREGVVNFKGSTTLLVSAVDRFGMAQALDAQGGKVIYGDLLFGIGVPVPIRSYRAVEKLASVLLPIITKLPYSWFYPTGAKQTQRTPKLPKVFAEADIVAGDWHYIRRFAPDQMPGKTVITQTLRAADIDLLRGMGVAKVVTTTPEVEGETFATNVMEAALVAVLGKGREPLTPEEIRDALARLDWRPNVVALA